MKTQNDQNKTCNPSLCSNEIWEEFRLEIISFVFVVFYILFWSWLRPVFCTNNKESYHRKIQKKNWTKIFSTLGRYDISRRVARKRGCHLNTVLKKLESAISVCIARRAARMSLACWPKAMGPNSGEEIMDHFLDDPCNDDGAKDSWYSLDI